MNVQELIDTASTLVALYHRVLCNQAARRGKYNASMEQETT